MTADASEQPTLASPAGPTSATVTDLSAGDVLADRYEIVSRLGKGGMGTVYEAWDRELERTIALKTIRPDVASSSEALVRLKQETLLARQISHRNVVRVFDLGVSDGVRFITMERVEGESLKAMLGREKKFPAESATALMTQVCEGLAAAHAEDVIHRDLKPQNVLVGNDGRVRIFDFGLARPAEETGITRSGVIIGTPDYMSPEQALGQHADARSDIFAFGVMFYELLTGVLPFKSETMVESFLARTRERAPEIESVEPSIPAQLARVVMRCLEPDPAQRYQNGGELLADLLAHDGEHSVARAAEPGKLAPGMMLGSRYRIEAEAGEGGMGKVYRATDLDLNRTVALKVVRPERARDAESIQRLKQEIALASRISHKNVLRIHDLGEVDGLRFISMAWADGDNLAHLIGRSAPLLEGQIVTLASEICEGLEAACQQGIIHRDLKPTNVLLDASGHACIADFGLASTLEAQQASPLEQPGAIAGTPRYMSPEQVEGKRTDHRTDIYSLGLILYEMATGDIPFKHDSTLQTMVERVTETPRDPKLFNPGLSNELDAIILRCLERDPLARYEDASALLRALRLLGEPPVPSPQGMADVRVQKWQLAAIGAAVVGIAAAAIAWFAGAHAPPEMPRNGKYIAVLPFRAVGADPNLKYEAEGVAEAISARLFSLSSVHPVSSFALEQVDLAQPVKSVARKVGANLVVEGILQSQGDSIMIIVSLDNVETGKRSWSKPFSGVRADLLTLEDEICNGVIAALNVTPSLAERERTAAQPTQNLTAYDEYLKGRDTLKNRRDAEGANAALTLFEEAEKKDPSFALAWSGMADASLEMYRLKHDSFWSEKALAAAKEAQSRNDNLPEVHLALGSIYTASGKNAQAVSEIQRALQLEPNSDDGYVRLGRAYLVTGQSEAAIAALKKAVDLNPYYWYNHDQLGKAYYAMGRDNDALKEFKRVVDLDPTRASAHNAIGIIYARHSPWQKCIPEFQRAIQLKPSADIYTNLATAYFNAGHYAESVPLFEKAVQLNPTEVVTVGNLADSYRQAKQLGKARATYDRAIALAYKQLEVNPKDSATLGFLALFYAKTGAAAKAQEVITRARAINAANSQLMYDEALVDALAGHAQESLKALARALENGYSLEEASQDPDLASVRVLPGFKGLVTKATSKRTNG